MQVLARHIAEDVIEDFEKGMEYAEADRILDVKRKGDNRTFLVK